MRGGAAYHHHPPTAGEPHAWSITVDGGVKSEVKGALGDARVQVRDLFYATPLVEVPQERSQ